MIPFWWNKTAAEVANALHLVRPDISLPPKLLKGGNVPVQPEPHADSDMPSAYTPQKANVLLELKHKPV